MMHHIIYKTTNLINSRYYIGMHSTKNINDGYLGSGKRLKAELNKYGKENFKREILCECIDRRELEIKEAEIVCPLLLEDALCLNLKNGGEGGGKFKNEEHRVKCSTAGNAARVLKIKNDPVLRKIFSDLMTEVNSRKLKIVSPRFTGKMHSPESKQQMSISRQGKQLGEKNSQYGVRSAWVVRLNEKPKKIKLELLDEYLNQGYIRGQRISPL